MKDVSKMLRQFKHWCLNVNVWALIPASITTRCLFWNKFRSHVSGFINQQNANDNNVYCSSILISLMWHSDRILLSKQTDSFFNTIGIMTKDTCSSGLHATFPNSTTDGNFISLFYSVPQLKDLCIRYQKWCFHKNCILCHLLTCV